MKPHKGEIESGSYAPTGLVRFSGLVLDRDACMLARDDGDAISLTRGEFALLRAFVARPSRVLSRDSLLKASVNRGHEPFDRSVDVMVGRLRRKIEPDPTAPRLIVTVPGEGYRFDGLRQGERPDQNTAIEQPSEGAACGPPRLSIVVLPFAKLGGDVDHEQFVDGVTDSLTTDMSRIPGSFVIGRNTAFTYKGKSIDLKQIGRELNVRYILEGSIQRSGNRMRVNVQLVDAESGGHLWSDRFDKRVADLFAIQDEIVARLAGELHTHLNIAEARRAERAPNPDSMDLYFQGLAWFNKGMTRDSLARARGLFDRAFTADGENVDALVQSAAADAFEGMSLFATNPAAALAAAETKLLNSLSSVPGHARGHVWLGLVEILTKRAAQGIARCEHALELDRNLASANSLIGYGKLFIDRAEETEAHIVEALRLSPRDTMAYTWKNIVGFANLLLGQWKEAAEWSRKSIEDNRNYSLAYFDLAAALVQFNQLDEARSAVEAGLTLNSKFSILRVRAAWRARSDNAIFLAKVEQIFEGMRKAGVSEL